MPLVLERSSPPVVGKGNQNWSIDAHRLQIGNLGAMNEWGSAVACGRGGHAAVEASLRSCHER